jgi:hypothetical protein
MPENETQCEQHEFCMKNDEYIENAFISIVEYFSNGFNESIGKICSVAVRDGIRQLHDEVIVPEIKQLTNTSGIVPEFKCGSIHLKGFRFSDIMRVLMVALNMLAGIGILYLITHISDIKRSVGVNSAKLELLP